MLPYWVDFLLIVVGLIIIAAQFIPRTAAAGGPNRRAEILRARRELGLAHRLGARLIGVNRRGLEDEGFGAVAELYLMTRPYMPRRVAYAGAIAGPLLETEQLLERLESLGARLRSLGRGRARGTT